MARNGGRRQTLPHHLARGRRLDRRAIDRRCCAPFRDHPAGDAGRRRARDHDHAGARRAVDRAAAAYGVALAMRADASDEAMERAYAALLATRPTAINLKWALDEMMAALRNRPRQERVAAAYRRAAEICDEDVAINQAIGRHGLCADRGGRGQEKPGERVNVLTHCNAGWLATVDVGTATAPIYAAHDQGCRSMSGSTRPTAQPGRLAHRLGARPAPACRTP